MEWIRKVNAYDQMIEIPIINTSFHGTFKWEEEETIIEFMDRHANFDGPHNHGAPLHHGLFSVWSVEEEEEQKDEDSFIDWGTFEIYVYDVKDIHDEEWYLLTFGDLTNPEEIANAVLLPYNKLNLLKFFKECALPFGGAKFKWE